MFSSCFRFEFFWQIALAWILAAMTSPSASNDDFFKNVINPYLAEVKMHPQVLQLKDVVLHKQDLQGPKKEGAWRQG